MHFTINHLPLLRLSLCAALLVGAPTYADDFLDPAQAFKASVSASDSRTLDIRFAIAPGYYLYRDKIKIGSRNAQLGEPRFPAGQMKHDDNFGDVEVFHEHLRLPVPVTAADAKEITVDVRYQGCAEAGLCYPPQNAQLHIALPAADSSEQRNAADQRAMNVATAPAPSTETTTNAPTNSIKAADTPASNDDSSRIAGILKESGLLTILFFFFLAGLGLALTPCVFPMIPILSGIIVGQGRPLSRAGGFALSLAYVLGMALTYASAGVAAGMTGTLLANTLQNAWALGSFALIFVVLSFSMFGFYELQLPGALQSRLSEGSGKLQGGRYAGVFVMGALSALIVGPCVAAPLAGALLYISQTGNATLGGLALFAMALGMGMPLLAVGLSAGSLLPRAGQWMENVKKFFGILLLATALWLVSPVLPKALLMLAAAALLIIPAIYLHALDPLPANPRGWQRFWKGTGVVMVIYGAALMIGALSGSGDPLQPLRGLSPTANAATANDAGPRFERVASLAELDRRIQQSAQPVLLDFYADWCVACKEMEHNTFSNAAVRQKLTGFTLLQADVTANNADDQALLKRFGLFGPPGIIFFSPAGQEIAGSRVIGYQAPERFLTSLNTLATTR